MPVTFQSNNPLTIVDGLDIPDPGPPPKEDAARSWAQVFRFLRKPDIDTKLEKSKDRARWAWSNFARHDKMLRQAKITTPQLDDARRKVMVEHQAFMNIYESAIAETSKDRRKAEAKRLTATAAKLQFRSLHFSKTIIDEISAQAAGRPHFPKRKNSNRSLSESGTGQHRNGSTDSSSQNPAYRNQRYERMFSLDSCFSDNINLIGSSSDSEDIGMQPLHDMVDDDEIQDQ